MASDPRTLIPGLPNDIAALILSYIPIPFHGRLKSTSKSWRAFLSSPAALVSLRRAYLPLRRRSHLLCIFPQDPSLSSPFLFDPDSLSWCPLPPMPINPNVYGLCNFNSISIGPHVYVIGGSLFDTRSFPIDRPSSSAAVFRFDVSSFTWVALSPMVTPRGSFACAADRARRQILVGGGGSRHTLFGAAGSRVSSVERYDIERDLWVPLDGMPRFRAGCVGFMLGRGEEREFWVMGGYGESRTVSGVFPVDEYYRDAVVMEVSDSGGGRWREVGDMWEEGERRRLGKIVVVDDDEEEEEDHKVFGIFMLDGNDIFRYNIARNRWVKETSVPRKAPDSSSFGFVALNGKLHVMTLLHGVDFTEIRRSRHSKRGAVLYIQIYDPQYKSWRSLITRPPFLCSLDFKTAVMCAVQL